MYFFLWTHRPATPATWVPQCYSRVIIQTFYHLNYSMVRGVPFNMRDLSILSIFDGQGDSEVLNAVLRI
jgi:hypothetical protein